MGRRAGTLASALSPTDPPRMAARQAGPTAEGRTTMSRAVVKGYVLAVLARNGIARMTHPLRAPGGPQTGGRAGPRGGDRAATGRRPTDCVSTALSRRIILICRLARFWGRAGGRGDGGGEAVGDASGCKGRHCPWGRVTHSLSPARTCMVNLSPVTAVKAGRFGVKPGLLDDLEQTRRCDENLTDGR